MNGAINGEITMEALSTTGNDRIKPGGNLSPFDAISLKIDELYDEAKNWADGEPIANQDIADAVTAIYDALHEAGKEAEALRVEEVKPLDEAKAAIQAKFHPLIGDTKAGKGKVVLGKAALNALLTDWRAEVKRQKDAAALKARLEAEEEARKAQEDMQASAGDLEARERAEEQLALAKEAERFASKLEKRADTGNGLRTVWLPELTDLNAAIKHYWSAKRDRFETLVTELAAEDVRAGKRAIPGFTIHETKKAI